jgi:hypothetical protein
MMLFQRLIRQWRWIVFGLVGVVFLPILMTLANPQQPPRSLSVDAQTAAQPLAPSCLPSQLPGISDPASQLSFELVGRSQANETEYRVYRVTRKQASERPAFTHIVALSNRGCRALATNAMGDDNLYLHRLMPLSAARQLALSQLQFFVKRAGGVEAFQSRLDQQIAKSASKEPLVLPEEEVWAFERMGLKLPSNIRVVPAPAEGVTP